MTTENNIESVDSINSLIIQEEIHSENQFQYHSKREILFKILVVGDYGVGKTSIIRRYADGTFSDAYKITIGADFALKSIEWDNNTRINLQIWDIAGHERFGSLTGVYYRYAVAAAIVFDLTRPETFKSVEKWLRDLRRKVSLPGGLPLPIVLLANKGDITIESLRHIEIVKFCEKFNILAWFITSAKDNVHIDEAMLTLIGAAIDNYDALQFTHIDDPELIKLQQIEEECANENKTHCC